MQILADRGCGGGVKSWTSNPDYVAGQYELLDADGDRVFGPVGDAYCNCGNCCEDSNVMSALGTPNYVIDRYEEC